MDPYYLSGNAFGYNHKEKTQICRFFHAYQFMQVASGSPGFEINGHKASVWFHYDVLHIIWPNGPIYPIG